LRRDLAPAAESAVDARKGVVNRGEVLGDLLELLDALGVVVLGIGCSLSVGMLLNGQHSSRKLPGENP
jgi:hypothetical protein